MNNDQNTRTNRDQEQVAKRKAGISPTTQAATEQSADKAPASRNTDVQSHRDFDEADLRKPSPTVGRFANVPDNQEGVGP